MFKSLFLNGSNIISLDIGTNSIKVLHLEVNKTSTILKDVFIVDNTYETSSYDVYYEIFRDVKVLLRENGIKSNRLVVTTSLHTNLETVIKLDVVDKKNRQNLIEVEYIKNFNAIKDFEEFIFDYEILGKFAEKGKNYESCLLAGINKNLSEILLESSKVSDFKLLRIGNEISSLNSVIELRSEEFTGSLIHMGNNYSKFILYKEDTVVFSRRLEYGYTTILRELMNELNCPKEIVVRHVRENGFTIRNIPSILENQGYEDILNRIMMNLINELYDTLTFVRSNYSVNVDKVYLSGGLSSYVGIKGLLTDFLKIEVVPFVKDIDERLYIEDENSNLSDDILIALGSSVSEGNHE